MFVMTVDQVASRQQEDLVDDALARLSGCPTRLPFTRTVGDEFQGVLELAPSVVDAILTLMRNGDWHIGVGVGTVEEPLPDDPRSARGPAFLAARAAVERAKHTASHLCVTPGQEDDGQAEDVEVAFQLLAALRDRRTEQGWQAVDLMSATVSRSEVASRLGITRQAAGQRLQAASWAVEQRAVPVLARLLTRADRAATPARTEQR